MADDGFGNFLASVRERDIDLLLLEEFHSDSTFTRWFCGQVGLEGVDFDGAWHSVSNTDGETDLLLRVRQGAERIGVFIENKIGADERPEQDIRYHRRAEQARLDGKIDAFLVIMIAPQRYLEGLPADRSYVGTVAFEAIEARFLKHNDRRSAWRGHVLREAIEQNRRSNNMLVNDTRTQFFLDYWQHLRANHPDFLMERPTAKGSKSKWVMFKGPGFPKGVGFTHKCDQGVIELGFRGRLIEDIPAGLANQVPAGAGIRQVGKVAAIQLSVPTIDFDMDLASQVNSIAAALEAASRMVDLAGAWKP